jgi:hypothetical protein
MMSLCEKYCQLDTDLDSVTIDSEDSCNEGRLGIKNVNPLRKGLCVVRDEGTDYLYIEIGFFLII